MHGVLRTYPHSEMKANKVEQSSCDTQPGSCKAGAATSCPAGRRNVPKQVKIRLVLCPGHRLSS